MSLFQRVLLVEHDDAIRIHLGRLIQHLWPTAILSEVTNGQEALEQYAQYPADVIVTDDVMPILNGTQLIAQLRMQGSSVPIILITQTRMRAELVAYEPITCYVAKRDILRDLTNALQQCLAEVDPRGCTA